MLARPSTLIIPLLVLAYAATPAKAEPTTGLENACDQLCAAVAQTCQRARGTMKLSAVSICVKACVADRLPEVDRRCYLARVRAKNRNARHRFCGHELGWPRLRPGGCRPAAPDRWIATRATNTGCKKGFVGVAPYPTQPSAAGSGVPHLAYCDAAGKLRVVLQRELAAKGLGTPAIQRTARNDKYLVIFRARRANCGAQLSLGIIDLAGHRATVRDIRISLGKKRWVVPQLALRASRALLTVRDRRGRIRDKLSIPLAPAARPASSKRCTKLRAKHRYRDEELNAAHPCWGVSGDPDHCP